MKSFLTALVHGRAWYLSLTRIVLLSALGWGTLKAANPEWNWTLPMQDEWSRTDFSKSVVKQEE